LPLLFWNLGVPRLWDEDEPRNASCAREMMERGDWITPTFNGQLRTDKPILLYWLMRGSYTVFGPTEFAARFWSAVPTSGDWHHAAPRAYAVCSSCSAPNSTSRSR
jgi:4-amino-4-deoxy-L-arabinose transferase-like glycosyltransferase